MKLESQPSAHFQAFTLDMDGNAHQCVFECNELLELKEFKPRRRQTLQVEN